VVLPRGIRLVFSAYDRGDFARAVRLGYPAEVVLELGELETIAPDSPPVLRGRDALQRFLEDFHEAFAWTRWTCTELIDFGDSVVFSVNQQSEGRASGARVETVRHSAVRLEDGLAVWQRFYPSREEAIRAIGRDPAEI
jgi:ketosteroid isomerase-like protein